MSLPCDREDAEASTSDPVGTKTRAPTCWNIAKLWKRDGSAIAAYSSNFCLWLSSARPRSKETTDDAQNRPALSKCSLKLLTILIDCYTMYHGEQMHSVSGENVPIIYHFANG